MILNVFLLSNLLPRRQQARNKMARDGQKNSVKVALISGGWLHSIENLGKTYHRQGIYKVGSYQFSMELFQPYKWPKTHR